MGLCFEVLLKNCLYKVLLLDCFVVFFQLQNDSGINSQSQDSEETKTSQEWETFAEEEEVQSLYQFIDLLI